MSAIQLQLVLCVFKVRLSGLFSYFTLSMFYVFRYYLMGFISFELIQFVDNFGKFHFVDYSTPIFFFFLSDRHARFTF